MNSKLDKVRKLIALAVSTKSEHEARTAALSAIRLMTDEGFVVSLSANIFDEVPRGSTVESNRRWPDSGPLARGRPKATDPDVKPWAQRRPKRKQAEQPPEDFGDDIVTTHAAGKCSACSDPYEKGEKVIWLPAQSAFCHLACYASAHAAS